MRRQRAVKYDKSKKSTDPSISYVCLDYTALHLATDIKEADLPSFPIVI